MIVKLQIIPNFVMRFHAVGKSDNRQTSEWDQHIEGSVY